MNNPANINFEQFNDTQIDELMSEIGFRLANEAVGKPLNDDDIDDILVNSLRNANESQLYEVVDNMIDLLSVSKLVQTALSDDNKLNEEEVNELTLYLNELEQDTKAVMIDLTR